MKRREFIKSDSVGTGFMLGASFWSVVFGQVDRPKVKKGLSLPPDGVTANIKIDQIEAFYIKGARGIYPIVRIKTNQGIEGIGECQFWGHIDIVGVVHKIGEQLHGYNPTKIAAFVDQYGRQELGLAWYAAISGIEMATCWCLTGPNLALN